MTKIVDAVVSLEQVRAAAQALINNVKERHPGEELHCPFMRRLDIALDVSKDFVQ